MSKTKFVYFFGNGKGEGNASMKGELGGKGANLAEMASIGLPVPPGFTISTDVCDYFWKNNKNYPKELMGDVDEYLGKLEKAMGKKLGDADDPLLVSVRSGAAVSMPGMMDTILNLGLNDKSVEGLAKKTQNERFAWDSYRRFIQMFGDVAMGVPGDEFEHAIDEVKAAKGISKDTDMTADDLKNLVAKYKEIYKKHTGSEFPQDAKKQMWGAIDAVFGSWMNSRAIKYRELNEIKGLKGTAVTVMAMVFGNKGDTSGTGVCFSRDPSNGVNEFMGEYLMNAQGEDVVAGIRTPEKLSQLEKENPDVYKQLCDIRAKLEKHYRDMQDMEFTVEEGKLFMLQCRNGKRTGPAAVKMAVDMVAEKLITKEEALLRVEPNQLDRLYLLPMKRKHGQKKARKSSLYAKKLLRKILPVWLPHKVFLLLQADAHLTQLLLHAVWVNPAFPAARMLNCLMITKFQSAAKNSIRATALLLTELPAIFTVEFFLLFRLQFQATLKHSFHGQMKFAPIPFAKSVMPNLQVSEFVQMQTSRIRRKTHLNSVLTA